MDVCHILKFFLKRIHKNDHKSEKPHHYKKRFNHGPGKNSLKQTTLKGVGAVKKWSIELKIVLPLIKRKTIIRLN